MADTTIDLKLYLSGTSAVEQGLAKLYTNLQQAHAQTEKFDKHVQQSVEGLGKALVVVAGTIEHMGWSGITQAAEGVSRVMAEAATSVQALNNAFMVLGGQSLAATVIGLQQMTLQCGATATAANLLAGAVTSLGGALRLCTGAAVIAGAAFVGWQIGKVIGDLDVFGMTVNERVTVAILKAMKVWARFKHELGFMDTEAFRKEMAALNESLEEQFKAKQTKPSADAVTGEPESGPGQPSPKRDEAKQRRDEQRLIASADTYSITDAEAGKQTWMVKAELGIKALNAQYEEWRKQETRTLDEELAKLAETAEAEGNLMQHRQAAERNALKAREDVVKRKIHLLKLVQDRTTEQNAELRELQAEEQRLLGEGNVLDLRHEDEVLEHTRQTQAKRLVLYQQAQKKIDDLNKARSEQAQAAAKTELDGLDDKLKTRLEALNRLREDLERDFRKTNAQKREEKVRLLKLEGKLYDEHIEKLEQLGKLQKDEGARKLVDGRADNSRKQRRGVSDKEHGMQQQPDPDSLGDQMTKVLVKMQNEMKTLAESIAGMFQGIVSSAIDSTAQSITGLIKGTMTWGQALQNIGDSILNSIISSFAQMAAQWIVNQILMWTVGKALGAASVAATAPMAAASAAMWAGPALMASISSYGAAVGAGQAALTAGLAANQASAVAFSTTGAVAAAKGGLITGPGTGTSDSIPALLSNGEFVIPAAKVAEFGTGFFEGIRNGAVSALDLGTGATGRSVIPPVNLAGMTPNVNVQSAQPKVIVVNSQEELMRVMKGSIGEEITVAHIAKNKLRLGMAS